MTQELSSRADARWRLGRQREVELFEQEFVIGLRMSVAAQDQGAAVGGRKCTSSICIVANLSYTARGVSPGASGRNRARKVTCRQ